jgi:hypothetical protein
MGWPCLSVVAMGDGPSRGQVGAPAAQRGRTGLPPVRAVAASFTEQQGGMGGAHRADLLGFWERDNGGGCVPAPSLIWVLEPATGQVRRQAAGSGSGWARPRRLGGRRRQGRGGRRGAGVGRGTAFVLWAGHPEGRRPSSGGHGHRQVGDRGEAASPSPIRCGRPGGPACGPPSGGPVPSTRVLTWVERSWSGEVGRADAVGGLKQRPAQHLGAVA